MKKFFTQPIGEFSRQNSLVFLVVNIVALAANFELFDIDPVQNLINFLWGFSLFGIVTSGYYLAEGYVPEYWKTAGGVLASVILVGTFLEMTPEYQETGFLPMYFLYLLSFGFTATAVSPNIVSGLVVAIVINRFSASSLYFM